MGLLSHNNARTMAPPGELPSNPGTLPIVVASMMRSGTHLVIDAILNNFKEYRGKPLYIDLDEWLRSGGKISDLLELEGVVLKTHYPQVKLDMNTGDLADFNQLLSKSHIIIPCRDSESVLKSASSKSFNYYANTNDFQEDAKRFAGYWSAVDHLTIPFESLVDRAQFPSLMGLIEKWIGVMLAAKIVYPFKKSQKMKVYGCKLLTRLIGKYAPIVNTTIGFAKR